MSYWSHMELWEMRNTILTWLTPSPVRDWLCNKSKRQWPWWCQRQLDEARDRAEDRVNELLEVEHTKYGVNIKHHPAVGCKYCKRVV